MYSLFTITETGSVCVACSVAVNCNESEISEIKDCLANAKGTEVHDKRTFIIVTLAFCCDLY